MTGGQLATTVQYITMVTLLQDDFASLTASANTAIQAKGHKKRSGSQREQLFGRSCHRNASMDQR